MPISLIICIRNEEKNIPHLLPSLYPELQDEVVFVLDRCTDYSKKLIEDFKPSFLYQLIEIKETFWTDSPKKFALLTGIQAAKNESLIFVDADCVLTNDHFKIYHSLFERFDVLIGYSIPEKRPIGFNQKLQFIDFLWTASFYTFFTRINFPFMAVGRNWGFKKPLFKPEFLESHNMIKSGDDDLLFQKLADGNNKIGINTFNNVSTRYQPDFLSFTNQKIRHLQAGIKYRRPVQIILGILTVLEFISIVLLIKFLIMLQLKMVLIPITFLLVFYTIIIKQTDSFVTKNRLPLLPPISFYLLKPVHTLFIQTVSLFSFIKKPKWK